MKSVNKFLYNSIRAWVKLTLNLFYVKIEHSGFENVAKNKSYIIVANHQNTLIDALLVLCFSPIKNINFLARADIFKLNTKVAKLLKFFKISPIFRPSDGMEAFKNIDKVWESGKTILNQGSSICLFPEGTHSNEYNVRPFKKGFLRLAEVSQMENIEILPVCLHYQNHFSAISKIWVEVCQPIPYKKGVLPEIEAVFKEKLIVNPDLKSQQKRFKLLQRQGLNFNEAVEKERTTEAKQALIKPQSIADKLLLILTAPLFLISSILFIPVDLLAYFFSAKMKDKQFSLSIQLIIKWLFFSIGLLIYSIIKFATHPFWYEVPLFILIFAGLGIFHKAYAYKLSLFYKV